MTSETNKTVLIIEDNEDNLVLIEALMQRAGYQTRSCAAGIPGVEAATNHRPDLLLLDIQLPDIDGYEVLKRIRALPSNGSIPVIAMTSYAMAGDREKLLQAGCTGYIEKPFDPMKVVEQIEDILRSAQ